VNGAPGAIEPADREAAIERMRALLREQLSEERARLRSVRWVSGPLALALVATLGVPVGPSVLLGIWVALVCILVLACFAAFTATFFFSGEDAIERRLARLDEELRETRAALDLAASGQPFALFLRSFDAERRGLGRSSALQAAIAAQREGFHLARYGDVAPIAYDTSHFEDWAKWQSQIALLGAIQRRLPVVLLGNLRMEAETGRELRALGVREVFVQATDWWSLVAALSAKANAIFFLVEQASPMLIREMLHVLDRGYPYVIVGETCEVEKLPSAFDAGRRFLESARDVIRLESAPGSLAPSVDPRRVEEACASLGI
jgi:hypothetical protein